MADNSLAGIKVLVSRPAHQAQTLCDMITQHGGRPLRLPVIEIVPLNHSLQALIKKLDSYDFAVFISPNAVRFGLQAILARGKIPDKLKLVTIGQASARKLLVLSGRKADIVPQGQYNSETLLAHSELQQDKVKQKKVIIFRGNGGRELLADELRHRGAEVIYAEVYQRVLPDYSDTEFSQIWSQQVDIITLTSNEALGNLLTLCKQHLDKAQLQKLWQIPLVVVTEKMSRAARDAGFRDDILIAEKASDKALFDAVLKWLSNNKLS